MYLIRLWKTLATSSPGPWPSRARWPALRAAEVTVGGLCDFPPPDGPDECPRDWPS